MRASPTPALSNISYVNGNSLAPFNPQVWGFQPTWNVTSTGMSQAIFNWTASAEL